MTKTQGKERILTIFLRLHAGKRLSKAQLKEEFGVDPKSIQRDIAFLREILEENSHLGLEIVFDSLDNTYRLIGKTIFNKKDILVISKILLENRALNKSELYSLLEGLLALLSINEKKEVNAIISSELLNYKSLTNDRDRIDTIWNLSEAIRRERMLEIEYKAPLKDAKSHIIFPVSLYYDAHYFYLVAYHLKHENYTTFRVDRIESLSESHVKKPGISYGRKYRDGDVRNQKVDAFEGRKIKVRLRYTGIPEIVLDQFPNHEILSEEKGNMIIQIETQDTPGLKRWILGQEDEITVLYPQSLADSIQNSLEKILKNYKK
ncbi:YafY family protein [Streptococcus sp. HMSC076C09]|uniref:helix-turn-helix transcriptional regulator n=1 Tax=Streptococcus sp. HMSC076C09 TaxID=1715183 RepID=UPI0008A96FCA|nr:WYL domain-containing protein [Streptococcus sp. HMSC076C09]OHQ87407.1 transcriptional regulator [Streptococcus sp. HMSC076C09]